MRILSGIQPSGKLHTGNYFGMMRPALELAQKGEAFYFIADYHSLTSVSDANELRANVTDAALDFLACGLDPAKTVFYRQSDVPQVTELTWILANVTPVPMLENAHSYKDKIAQGVKPNAGRSRQGVRTRDEAGRRRLRLWRAEEGIAGEVAGSFRAVPSEARGVGEEP